MITSAERTPGIAFSPSRFADARDCHETGIAIFLPTAFQLVFLPEGNESRLCECVLCRVLGRHWLTADEARALFTRFGSAGLARGRAPTLTDTDVNMVSTISSLTLGKLQATGREGRRRREREGGREGEEGGSQEGREQERQGGREQGREGGRQRRQQGHGGRQGGEGGREGHPAAFCPVRSAFRTKLL